MRVLLIAERVELRSGWGRYASSIMTEYRKNGVDFVTLSVAPSKEIGVVKENLAPLTLVGLVQNCILSRKYAKECDVVHAFDVWPFALYGWLAVIGTRKKLYITGVGTYSVAPFDNLFKKMLLVPACRRAQKIFSIGSYTKKRMLEKVSLDNIQTVFWGVSKMKMLPEHRMLHFYKLYNLSPSRGPIVLTVGMIKNRKGQLDTLRAISTLVDSYPDILYIVVGSDEDTMYVESLRLYAKEKGIERNLLIVSDASSDEALSFFYQSCDVFAMNSNNDGEHFEGFGLVFLEVEQFGKPVIGSRNCGIEEALKDGYNGYLTEQGNAADIATKLRSILSGNRNELASASREFVSKFSWEKTASTYLEYYRE